MEKSYDENLAKLMSEARDLFKSSNFSESARKYWEAAKKLETARGLAQAEDLYNEAIKNFIRASEDNKEKKQYRLSAQNLFYVVMIFKRLGAIDDWKAATMAVVDDLVNAAQEYLLWNEYDKGIILVSTACFFLFSIEEFKKAEEYYTQYIEQIKDDPGFTRAQQILFAAGHAIKAVKNLDTDSLLNAQQLVGTHLKPGLSQITGDLFFPAIDDAVDTVVKIFRSKIKLPKIVPELKISRDLVLGEPTDLSIFIENVGEGESNNLSFSFNIPEGIEVIDGNKEVSLEKLPPQQKTEHKLIIRCMSSIGEITHELSVNITFYDQLQTKQTMMIGPYDLIFREKSLSKEHENTLNILADQNEANSQKMYESKIAPKVVCDIMSEFVSSIIKESKEKLSTEEFETVHANIQTINKIFDTIDKITSEEFLAPILAVREKEQTERIESAIELKKEEWNSELEVIQTQLAENHLKEKEELKQSFEDEKVELEKQKEEEWKELMEKLVLKHTDDIKEFETELIKLKEQEMEELSKKLEQEKKKALEEQEAVLRDEFQRLLSESQGKKRR
ncbi:MAG: hypothetical protein KAJ72_00050 [Candidatus Heimdallarchaeota archaeon]|nr:hypothetical protein [Candidatus Heimdallarchaeota archaeon]